jgi:tetratricopeptide (TPR) repeat protein
MISRTCATLRLSMRGAWLTLRKVFCIIRPPMTRRTLVRGLAAGLLALIAAAAPAVGADNCADLARRALAECEAGRQATARMERQAHFERGQALGEQAVAADDASADAHFALFCNLGELMRLDGENLSQVFQLRRLMAELDRTLELDPNHVDAMAAKGTLLVRLPRLLGGDSVKGEAMLRQVLLRDPNAFTTRLALANVCEARGDRQEALAFAARALQIAREQGRADKVAEAQAALSELRATR